MQRAFDPIPIVSAGEVSGSTKSALTWARKLKPRFKWFAYYSATAVRNWGGPNRAVTGETAAQNLARISEIKAMSPAPAAFYLASGTNSIRDTVNNPTAAQIFADLVSMISAVRAAFPGIPVLFSTIRATANTTEGKTYGITAAQLTAMLAVNDMIRAYCGANSGWCRLVDAYYAYAQADGYANSALFEDGLHPNQAGAYLEYRDHLGPAIDWLMPAGSVIETGTNLFALDFATGGGTVANGVTGTVVSGMQGTRSVASGSSSVVASLVSEPSAVPASDKYRQVVAKQAFSFTPGGAGIEQFRFGYPNTFTPVTIPNNAWVKLLVDIEASDYAYQYIQAELYLSTTSGVRSVGGKGSATQGYATNGFAGAYTLATEAIPCVGTSASLLVRFVVAVDGLQAGAPVVKFSNVRIVAVPDPSLTVE